MYLCIKHKWIWSCDRTVSTLSTKINSATEFHNHSPLLCMFVQIIVYKFESVSNSIYFQISLLFTWEKSFYQLTLVHILLVLISVDLFAFDMCIRMHVCVCVGVCVCELCKHTFEAKKKNKNTLQPCNIATHACMRQLRAIKEQHRHQSQRMA